MYSASSASWAPDVLASASSSERETSATCTANPQLVHYCSIRDRGYKRRYSGFGFLFADAKCSASFFVWAWRSICNAGQKMTRLSHKGFLRVKVTMLLTK